MPYQAPKRRAVRLFIEMLFFMYAVLLNQLSLQTSDITLFCFPGSSGLSVAIY
jgi:hypothetical protein